MKLYSEFLAELPEPPPIDPPINRWIAYNKGECTIVDTRAEAENISRLYEMITVNETIRNEQMYQKTEYKKSIYSNWFEYIKDLCPCVVNLGAFNDAYSLASRHVVYNDYDDIAYNLLDIEKIAVQVARSLQPMVG